MEQRRLRLGDILDDYCPRERRVTNHAIVAMVEDDVKQTRCTTCDAEHAYKGGQAPRKRRKDSTSALYKEVLAGMPDGEVPLPRAADTLHVIPAAPDAPAIIDEPVLAAVADDPSFDDQEPEPEDEPVGSGVDDGPIHRRLIRATLPRPEGQKEVRQEPDFTIRSNGHRNGGGFRGDRMRGHGAQGNGNGNGHGNGMRAGGRRFGQNAGPNGNRSAGAGRNRQGFGGGPARGGNQGRPQGGRKRSR